MRTRFLGITLVSLAIGAVQLTAPAFGQAASAAQAAHYSVETTLVGKLIADPAAAEILKKLIPSVWANEMFHSMGKDQTLKAIQVYEPEALNDAKLAEIQAEFNKIPAK